MPRSQGKMKAQTMISKGLKPAVVLVADRTLSADYRVLFEGIFGSMQTTQVPEIVMRRFLARPVQTDGAGRAATAPLGLRRIEAALFAYAGLSADEVVCTTPEALPSLLGPWVKVVGFSSSDPLGRGMSNTTTTNFWKGQLYTRFWTRRLLEGLTEAKRRCGFKVVAGGAGAWQWALEPEEQAKLGVDVVFDGYFESSGAGLIDDLVNGRDVQAWAYDSETAVEKIKPIKGASMLGMIELSRGCGRGCKFCTVSARKMRHVAPDTILADLETNVAAGVTSVVSSSEDFFRYGSVGLKPDFDKLHGLLRQIKAIKGVSFMQIDHGNITSVLQLTDEQLRLIRELLTWEKRTDYLWVNMGIESANGRLVAANCPGKIAPFRPEDWEQLVREAADKMTRNGFYCVFSIILGLPGETPDDVTRTVRLVKDLGSRQAVIFPIFYEPFSREQIDKALRFTIKQMRPEHLELYRACYEINFKFVPRLFWDNQRAGGVSWLKRAMMQVLGKTEVFSWRRTFKKMAREFARPEPGAIVEDKTYAQRRCGCGQTY